jgi:hypothetical protein
VDHKSARGGTHVVAALKVAGVWLLAAVFPHVDYKTAGGDTRKVAAPEVAGVWLLAGMRTLMG